MDGTTKKYTIEFLYADNKQLYQADVELSCEEYSRVNKFLRKLERTGAIELTTEGGCFIYQYRDPQFICFEQLEADWKAGTLEYGKDHEMQL